MTDVRLKEYLSLEACTMDFLLRDTGFLDEREELETAVRVALGTDGLASDDDILPDPDSTDRRGWWGDLDAEEIWGGWPIGCKNWLLLRAKIADAPSKEGATLERARRYTLDALQPFVDKQIASHVDATSNRTELQRIDVTGTIYRGPLEEINLRYQLLWQEEDFNEDPPMSTSVNILIRIPYRTLHLSTTGPRMPIKPVAAQFVLSKMAPTVFASLKRAPAPASGNLVISKTPPTRTP